MVDKMKINADLTQLEYNKLKAEGKLDKDTIYFTKPFYGYALELKRSRNCTVDAGKVYRRMRIELLAVYGDLSNVPIDKTYENRSYEKQEDGTWKHIEIVTVKLEITENGMVNQRVHNLYKSSKKGYYAVVCGKKVYFNTEDIESKVKEYK